MESRSSSPSPGQSGQDDREEDAEVVVVGGNFMDEMVEEEDANFRERDLFILDHEHESSLQRLDSDSEAVAQRSAEQDSDDDYEHVNAHLISRHRQPESPGAAATSSSTFAVVDVNSAASGGNRSLAPRRNLQEEPGSSSQLVSGANSVGASGYFHGAMMLSDEDIDPEIDSAASNHFAFNSNNNRNLSNFAHIGDSQDYWQASSSTSANHV